VVLFPRIIRDLRIERVASSEPATTVGVAIVEPAEAANPVPATDGSVGQTLAVATSSRLGAAPKASAAPSSVASGVAPGSGAPPSGAAPSGAAPSGAAPSGAAKNAAAAVPAVDADKPCKEETWPYFDSKCLWGGPPKDAGASAQSTRIGTATAAGADVAAAAVAAPEQRQVVPKRKAKATAVVRRRHREDPEPRTANSRYGRAYGYGYGQYASPYGNPFNSWRGGGNEQRGWGW
jgi:hypothetical protein